MTPLRPTPTAPLLSASPTNKPAVRPPAGQDQAAPNLRLALPKGRMEKGVAALLAEAGLALRSTSRSYRPELAQAGFDTKLLKPRAVIEMLAAGTRDLGFAGADWVQESEANLIELLDTGLDRVQLVVAAPESILVDGRLPDRPLVVASEYASIAQRWIDDNKLDATVLRSYGATEVLPPEDADCIIDNTATGATLAANALEIIDVVMSSSTRLYASKQAMADQDRRQRIETFAMLVESVLEARQRVMVELNVGADALDALVEALPCMREPTVSSLRSSEGFAVRVAVKRSVLPTLIPLIKSLGGTDIVVTKPEQIVP